VSDRPLTVEQILTILAETPPRIASFTTDLPPAKLQAPPYLNEWSATEVLAHLRACADVWGDCIRLMLAEDRPTLRAVNPRTWIKQTDYLQLDFRDSLRAFAAQRADLLTVLEALPPVSWSRAATVTGAGKILERAVHSYAQWMATHERPHVKQIGRIAQTP
jgi:hypothetical protein